MNKNEKSLKKYQTIVLVINLSVTVGLGLLMALLPESSPIGIKFAVLALHIVALLSVLQFFIGQKFTEVENEIKIFDKKITDIEKCIGISELYKKILKLDNNKERDFHLNNLNSFQEKLNKFVKEGRSGGLPKSDYYDELHRLAGEMKKDFEECKDKQKYKGEIWAMSFWQDDEWDKNSNQFEGGWIKALEEMDELKIKTVRVAVMTYKKTLLKQKNVDKGELNLIEKLVDNCHAQRKRQNTTIFFVDDIDRKTKDIVGKGFFAVMFDNGELSVIRGVSLDNLEDSLLEGELVFSSEQAKKIRDAWSSCLKIGKTPEEYFLNQYENEGVSEEMKIGMVEKGLNWFERRSIA